MSSSPEDGRPSLEENERLLARPRNTNGIEIIENIEVERDANTVQNSFYPFSFGEEEESFTARPNSLHLWRDRPTNLTARSLYALYRWIQGPRSPRALQIKSILPRLQNAPLAFLQKYFPGRRRKICLLAVSFLLWMSIFLGVLSRSLSGCQIPGYKTPTRLSCVSRFWRSSTLCGIDASGCRPFNDLSFAFRCPADCRETIISSPETIGNTEYNYRSMVVGGSTSATSPIYRGDSFICGAAIHAGIFTNHNGGSGVVSLVGEHNDFQAIDANGISSLNFTPSFPVSFTFLKDKTESTAQCNDPRLSLSIITALFAVMVSLFTTSPSVFFGSTIVSLYFYVALVSDPPDFGDYMSVVSSAFRGFLPAVFVGLVIYHFCVHHSLKNLTAQIEKTILWQGGCWLGALSNLTFERLPIQRLTLHDLQQPGAILTLVIVVLAILLIAVFQALAFRKEGRLPRYLIFYACVGLLLLALTAVPYTYVRIHHYIIALILLPGTTLQTRPSLFYQGLLVGLFINGIARWGFDSILQTPTDLFGADFNSPIPEIAMPIVSSINNSITFSWSDIHSGYDGMSILVNDVERFRGFKDQDNSSSFTWTRYKENEPEYFRFAYVKYGLLTENSVGKFSKPGTWESDGAWIPPEPGEAE